MISARTSLRPIVLLLGAALLYVSVASAKPRRVPAKLWTERQPADTGLSTDTPVTMGAFSRLAMLRLQFTFEASSEELSQRLVHQALGLNNSTPKSQEEL